MGFKIFRMSISWSRIFPNGIDENPNKKGVEFYTNVFKELKKYNIKPLVTLWHFDTPLYLDENFNGWQNRKDIDIFEKYAKFVIKEYDEYVDYWITFNEINNNLMFLDIYYQDATNDDYVKAYQSLHNQFVASARVVKYAHKINKKNMVGCMINGITYYPESCNPDDVWLTLYRWQQGIYYCSDVQCKGRYGVYAKKLWLEQNIQLETTEQDYIDLKEGTVDMYTFSYYLSTAVSVDNTKEKMGGNFSSGVRNPYLKYTDWGWTLDPKGLRYFLNVIYDRYELPIMIVENGLGAQDKLENDKTIHDEYRIQYLKEHIQSMKNAIEIDGVNVIGYTSWGCIDIVSAGTGEMKKRYGFIYVDKDDYGNGTYERYKKDSFYWYRDLIKNNGSDL